MFENKEIYYDLEQDELFVRLTFKDLALLEKDRKLCQMSEDHPGLIAHVVGSRLLREGISEGRYAKIGKL